MIRLLISLGLFVVVGCAPSPATPSIAGRHGTIADGGAFAFTDFDTLERFFDTPSQSATLATARMLSDGVLVQLPAGEPITIMGERSHTYQGYEVQLASGRHVWLSPKVVRLNP